VLVDVVSQPQRGGPTTARVPGRGLVEAIWSNGGGQPQCLKAGDQRWRAPVLPRRRTPKSQVGAHGAAWLGPDHARGLRLKRLLFLMASYLAGPRHPPRPSFRGLLRARGIRGTGDGHPVHLAVSGACPRSSTCRARAGRGASGSPCKVVRSREPVPPWPRTASQARMIMGTPRGRPGRRSDGARAAEGPLRAAARAIVGAHTPRRCRRLRQAEPRSRAGSDRSGADP
jgi:hypothetical protein